MLAIFAIFNFLIITTAMLRRTTAFIAAMAANALAADACTSLLAGRAATADSCVMITYAADSHSLYGELYNQPAADHPRGAMRKVVEWDTGKHLGEIPEVAHTYATIGNMNEHGLSISESTWGGREELADSTGVIDYGSLIYIALQRARTAREAIKVMTDLVRDHGYYSEGESFSIADGKEAWIMEMIGKGGKERGAVWVARRVPDDCIAGHANHSRIHQFPLNDPENCLYSPDVITFARKMGYFDGKDSDFSFSRAYAVTDFSALRGCDARVWSFYNRYRSDMDRYLPWVMRGEGEPLPLWVKPERKLSVRDMQEAMRDHFEDTPFDMTRDPGAGPYKVPYRWRPMTFTVDSVEYTNERAIATQQTAFTFVAQMRDHVPAPMKGVLWFGTDDTNTTLYVPIYCCVTTPPRAFEPGNGDLYNISWDSSFWVNNFVANQAYNRYSQMIPDIRRVQRELEDGFAAGVAEIEPWATALCQSGEQEKAVKMLNDFSHRMADSSTARYKQLGDYLLVKYLDGNIKREKDGEFQRTSTGLPASPIFGGYSDDYYRAIARETGDRLKVTKID